MRLAKAVGLKAQSTVKKRTTKITSQSEVK